MSGRREQMSPLMRVDARRVMEHLRQCGVSVEYAAAMPSPTDPVNGEAAVVVFLSKSMRQQGIARGSALRIPEVRRVTFSGICRSVMYVYSGTAESS